MAPNLAPRGAPPQAIDGGAALVATPTPRPRPKPAKPPKPTAAEILAARPLSDQKVIRGARACNLCGKPSAPGQLKLMRECDQNDRPIEGDRFLLFVGSDHPDCVHRVDDHPRLYAESRGTPGTFPKLCGSCIHRQGFACINPKRESLGGPGIKVGLSLGGIVCLGRGRGGCQSILQHVLTCEGQELPGEATAGAASP